jgi:hypothetical protein
LSLSEYPTPRSRQNPGPPPTCPFIKSTMSKSTFLLEAVLRTSLEGPQSAAPKCRNRFVNVPNRRTGWSREASASLPGGRHLCARPIPVNPKNALFSKSRIFLFDGLLPRQDAACGRALQRTSTALVRRGAPPPPSIGADSVEMNDPAGQHHKATTLSCTTSPAMLDTK